MKYIYSYFELTLNNQIRTRAWGGNLPEDKKWNSGMSKDEFRDKVMDERLRELCFEGWRVSVSAILYSILKVKSLMIPF